MTFDVGMVAIGLAKDAVERALVQHAHDGEIILLLTEQVKLLKEKIIILQKMVDEDRGP